MDELTSLHCVQNYISCAFCSGWGMGLFPGLFGCAGWLFCIERCLICISLALEMHISVYYNEDWLNEGLVVNTDFKRYNLFA